MSIKELISKDDFNLILDKLKSKEILLKDFINELELLLYENKRNEILKKNLIKIFTNVILKLKNLEIIEDYNNILKIIFYLLNNELIMIEELTTILSIIYEKVYLLSLKNQLNIFKEKFEEFFNFLNNGYFNTTSYTQKIRYNIIKIFLLFINKINNFENELNLIKIILDIVDNEKDPRNILLIFKLWEIVFIKFNIDSINKFQEDIYENISCYFPITFNQNNKILNQDDLIKNIVNILTYPLFKESFIELIFEKINEGDNDSLISCFKSLKYLLEIIININLNEKYDYLKLIFEKLKMNLYELIKIDLIDQFLPVIKNYFSNLIFKDNLEYIPIIKIKENFINFIFNKIKESTSSKNSYISYMMINSIIELGNNDLNNLFYTNFLEIIKNSFEINKISTTQVYLEEFLKIINKTKNNNKEYKIKLPYFEIFFDILKNDNFKNNLLMILLNNIIKNKNYDNELIQFYNNNIKNKYDDLKYIKISCDFIINNFDRKNNIIELINKDLNNLFIENKINNNILELFIYLINFDLLYYDKIFLLLNNNIEYNLKINLLKIIYKAFSNSKILQNNNNQNIDIVNLISKLYLNNNNNIINKEINKYYNEIVLIIINKLINFVNIRDLSNFLMNNYHENRIKKLTYKLVKNNWINIENNFFKINENKYECKTIYKLNLKNEIFYNDIMNYENLNNKFYIYTLLSGLIKFNNNFYNKLITIINESFKYNICIKKIIKILYKNIKNDCKNKFIYYKRIYLLINQLLTNNKNIINEKIFFKYKIINMHLAPFEIIKTTKKENFKEILNYFIKNIIEDEKLNFLKLCNKLIKILPELFIDQLKEIIDIFKNYNDNDYENIKEFYLLIWNISNLNINEYNELYDYVKIQLKLGLANKNRMIRKFNGMIMNNFEVNLN